MKLLANIAQPQTRWARTIFGLFSVMWLNLALQPCALAIDTANEPGCPHCLQLLAADIDTSSEHRGDGADPCASACSSSASQCDFIDEFNYDGRMLKLKVEDAQVDMPFGVAPATAASSVDDELLFRSLNGAVAVSSGVPRPLNVLNCVYLI